MNLRDKKVKHYIYTNINWKSRAGDLQGFYMVILSGRNDR